MADRSAGILLYRNRQKPEVLLVHPGGPFFSRKDAGAWSIPKGVISDGEDPLEAAKREFKEETGVAISGHFIPLQPIRQKGGKVVQAWAIEGDLDTSRISSNTFELQWPPQSGKIVVFPEIDQAQWYDLEQAREKINERQIPFLEALAAIIAQ